MELFGTMFDFLDDDRNGRSPNSVIDELYTTEHAKSKSKDPPNTTLRSTRGRAIKSVSTSASSSRAQSSTPSLPPRLHSYFLPNTINGRTTRHHRHHQLLPSTMRKSIDESEKSEEIPIPPSPLKRSFSSVDNLDRGQLTDVYNNATWCMFERITTGRRRQLEGLPAEVQAEVMSEGRRRQRRLTATIPPPDDEALSSASPSSVASTEEPTFEMEL